MWIEVDTRASNQGLIRFLISKPVSVEISYPRFEDTDFKTVQTSFAISFQKKKLHAIRLILSHETFIISLFS
jgi:hypothetical protein